MILPKHPVEFRKIGGSFQFSIAGPEDLAVILTLDPALWAAVMAPVDMLHADKRFLTYLDAGKSGRICVDDVCTAITMVQQYFSDVNILADPAPGLPVRAIEDCSENGRMLHELVDRLADTITVNGVLQPDAVAAKLEEVADSPFLGNGILIRAAVEGSGAEALYDSVLAYTGGTPSADGKTPGITLEQLEKFCRDVQNFRQWSRTAVCPQFRGQNPAEPYAVFRDLEKKLEEFFNFCDLVKIDPVHARRFRLNPEVPLPPVDLASPEAVRKIIDDAPLALPNARGELDLTAPENPACRERLENFSRIFSMPKITRAQLQALRQEFAPYQAYLDQAGDNLISRLAPEKLQEICGEAPEQQLRELFARDSRQGTGLQQLRTLDMLILYKMHLMNFVNNFVSFKALFSPDSRSLLQAGSLVMDAHVYSLALRIPNIAEHKKIAAASNLCIVYLEMVPNKLDGGPHFFVAVAMTGGDLQRIYKGKPAYFIAHDGKHYYGKVLDILDGPISFGQTVTAPFRKLSRVVTERLQKITDFSTVEKQIEETVTTGKLPPVKNAPVPVQKGLFGGNGSMFLLAGGISVAALSAAFSFLVKSLTGMMETLSKMSFWHLFSWGTGILLFILVPISINAVLKMRSRNLTLFLEASGWAVNLPMRLNFNVSGLFTRTGIYPAGTRFNRIDWVRKVPRRIRSYSIVLWCLLGLALLAWGIKWYLTRL